MNLTLTPEIRKLVERNMERGGYATPEEAILAGMAALEQQMELGDFAPGEMDRLLAQGEASGEFLDGDKVLEELRELRRGPRDARP